MVEQGPASPPTRASDAERERAIRVLRDRSVEGRLSFDTFIRRLDRAFHARSRAELAALLEDLPPQGRVARHLTHAVSTLSTLVTQVQAAWRGPRLPRLALPSGGQERLLIGRAAACDLMLADLSVSRHHAELRRQGEEWLLADLGSTNGTHLNGWRISGPVSVRPGDLVAFGSCGFCIVAR
jgi:hypothetical protein